jgi:hypothetical protein
MGRRFPGLAIGVSCGILLTVALLLASCESETAVGTSAQQGVTIQTVTTEISRESKTTTTTEAYETMTTSVALGIAASDGIDVVEQLGDAAISYLSGERDLAAVQSLVVPSAQEGLSQMLSLLDQPTSCKVMVMSNYGSNETEADLLFVGGTSEPADFYVTILVDPVESTVAITRISPDAVGNPHEPATTTLSTTVTTILEGSTTGASLPVIQIQTEPKLDYMSYPYSYFTAEAVALATVVEVLPLRRNPLAQTGSPDGSNEHQPIVYKGYVLEVEKAYGPDTIPKRITVYALGNGTIELHGVTYEVREEFPLDAGPGDRLFVPLMKVAYFGTPELKADEYWVQANWAAFAVDESGHCTRVTGAEVDVENRSEFPLSFLEDAAVEQGKEPSAVH